MALIQKIELTPREAALALSTIVALCLIAGALYGAIRSQQRDDRAVAECEARTGTRCVLRAVPESPDTRARILDQSISRK